MSVVFRIKGLHFYFSTPSTTSTGQSSPSYQEQSRDTWNEIDRRNEQILHPLNSLKSSKTAKHFSNSHDQLTRNSTKSFYFNSYHSYRPRPQSSEQIYLNPSIYLNRYINKQSSNTPINNDPTFLFGNSIIKSNKADILNVFDQQLLSGDNNNIYTDKYGVDINEDGPFWPENYRILHPTPRLLSRELTPKEFYLSPSISSKKREEQKGD